MPNDIEIARAANLQPIGTVAERAGIAAGALEPYGAHIAKIDTNAVAPRAAARRPAHLILVTAINPTPAGEGKTTTSIGLGDALSQIGKKTLIYLRDPSMGPCFGVKGGATGGGAAQVAPAADIN